MRRKVIADGAGALPALEEVCAECEGEGRIPARQSGRVLEVEHGCNRCHGDGTLVTDDGRRLLEFLRAHAR